MGGICSISPLKLSSAFFIASMPGLSIFFSSITLPEASWLSVFLPKKTFATYSLSWFVKVFDNYQVCVRTEDWQDEYCKLGVYIPPDSVVPDIEYFKFLEGHLRIKAK